jgi:hypothetical protein
MTRSRTVAPTRAAGSLLVALLSINLTCIATSVWADAPVRWKTLLPGLELGTVRPLDAPRIGDGVITIVRVDTKRYRFKLVATKQVGGRNRTAADWAKAYGLLVAINAGMFLTDHKTSVGYMRNGSAVLQSRVVKHYNAAIAFGPRDGKGAAGGIFDLKCTPLARLNQRYRTVVQSLRMIDCRRRNRWGRSPKRWSVAMMARDGQGRALFIHSRTPWTMRAFIDRLLRLPIDIREAIYLEGGPEATLFVNAGGIRIQKVGSYETGFNENDGNRRAWALPNVIGITPRK